MQGPISSSIIIPCFNCSKTILLCLHSLELQETKPREIIVVDDGSTDNTLALLESFKQKTKLNLGILKQNHAGPAAARNLGAKASDGKAIVFLDSDCIAPKDWLGQLLAPLALGFSGVGCQYRTRNVESLVARYVGLEIAFRHEKMLEREVDCFGSYSAAFLRQDFLSVGGFDVSFKKASGEDFALTFALRAKGKSLFFTGKTFVYHFHPASLWKFLGQQFWRGYWRMPLYLQNKKRILKSESYSGFEAQAQFFLSAMLLLSIPVSVFLKSIFPFFSILFLLFLSNLPLGIWCARKEKKFILIAPLFASLRSIAGTIGGFAFLFGKPFFKNK